MANWRVWVPVVAILPLCLLGCDPDDMPAYTPDGKTVIAMAQDAKGENVLWTCDVATGETRAHRVGWDMQRARLLGGQVWVECYRPGKQDNLNVRRFDPGKNLFLPAPVDATWLRDTIPLGLDGAKHLLLGGQINGVAYSYPELKKVKTLGFPEDVYLMAAGGFWSLQIHRKPQKEGAENASPEVERIEVFNPEGKQSCSIPRTEADKAIKKFAHNAGYPAYAHVSKEGDVLLLAFGDRGDYDFGLFDTASGKFLWGGFISSCGWGAPLVKRTEIWMICQSDRSLGAPASMPASQPVQERKPSTVLTRYAKPAGAEPAVREVVLEYPAAFELTEDRFSPSPDGSHFVMVVNGNPSRLLFIPIRQGVTAKDVRVVELKEK